MAVTQTPVERLLERAQEHPNKVYLRQPTDGNWTEYTWAQVADQVSRVAAGLRKLGLSKGDCIAIAGRNTAHWMMGDFASQMSGAAAVGLYPKMSTEHVKFVLEHSEAKAIFYGPAEDHEQVAECVPEGVIRIGMPYAEVTTEVDYTWDQLVADNEPLEDFQPHTDDELLALIYTSGTTGNPKGVMITAGNAKFTMTGYLELLGNGEGERWFSYLPLAHIFERGSVAMVSVYQGSEVSFLENQGTFARDLASVAPTRMIGVPLIWTRLQRGIQEKMPQKKLDTLLKLPIVSGMIRKKILTALGMQNVKLAFSGAAPIGKSTIEFWEALGIDICQGYGMSENCAYCAAEVPGARRIGSVGKIVPGAEVKIADSGEIMCRHDAVSPGYFKNPEKTAEDFEPDGWLHTGDRGRLDEDGYLWITGRVKDIFKTDKGKYIAPAPIEGAFSKNQYVEGMCLIGAGHKQPVMIATTSDAARDVSDADVATSIEATVKELNGTLEPQEKIAKVVISRTQWSIEEGHYTPTMKVRRHHIEELYSDNLPAWYGADSLVIWN